jgi:hypothetical protein
MRHLSSLLATTPVVALLGAACGQSTDLLPDTRPAELELTLEAAPTSPTNDPNAVFAFSATATATFTCRVDEAAPVPCTSPWSVAVTEGVHVFALDAVGPGGATASVPPVHVWTVDVTAPTTDIVIGPDPIDNSIAPYLQFASSEPGVTFVCALDDAPPTPCTSPLVLSVDPGDHTFAVHAVDAAGNRDDSPATRAWTVDTSTPDTSIDDSPSGVVGPDPVDVTFSSDAAGAEFECALDGAAFTPCTSPMTLAELATGDHVFQVRVTNAAGTTDPSPATRIWSVDGAGPSLVITSAPSPTIDRTPTLEFTVDDPAGPVTTTCAVDGVLAPTPCVSPWTSPLLALGDAVIRIEAVDRFGNTTGASTAIVIPPWLHMLYAKASNAETLDQFGFAVAASADGSTLAIGAHTEDSSTGGAPTDNGVPNAGAVYVLVRDGETWREQAYLKAAVPGAGDYFGFALALSDDGNTLAIGARDEAGGAPGIDGDQTDNSMPKAGAAYVFARAGETWTQQAYVKASNPGYFFSLGDSFGVALALAGDGNTLAVGAYGERSSATGIDGDELDDSLRNAGAVYTFARAGATWAQTAYIKASNTDEDDYFGRMVALSGDGSTLAVGAFAEDSAAAGVDGDDTDNSLADSGAVYVFTATPGSWAQQAYLKAAVPGAGDQFGLSVALSTDGSTLAVGAVGERSSAVGVNGDQGDDSLTNAGAAYVFSRAGATWSQQAYVKASTSDSGDFFGWLVTLAGDGNRLAVVARDEASAALGLDGNADDDSAPAAGAVYTFARSGSVWTEGNYLKATNTDAADTFGRGAAMARDGRTLAIGAPGEDGGGSGLAGEPAMNDVAASGALYVIRAPD